MTSHDDISSRSGRVRRAVSVVIVLLALMSPSRTARTAEITWTFDTSVPPAYVTYIDDLLHLVYPEISALYGEPSHTHTITIAHDSSVVGGYYDPQSDRIVLGDLPNGGQGNTFPDPGWDYFITHEFTHAFHGNYYFHSWVEEGMTEATNQLLTRRLQEEGLRDLQGSFDFRRAVRWYDTFANMGPQVLGGVDWSPYYADWWAAAESYTAVFTILALSQVTGNIGDWTKYQAFVTLNNALYDANPTQMIIPESVLFDLVSQSLSQRIDDQPPEGWLGAQPIAARPAHEGRHLGVYASRFTFEHDTPVNPNQVVFFAFQWGPDPTYPSTISQLRIENRAEVRIRIFDVDNQEVFAGVGPLLTQAPNYPNGNSLALPDTRAWTRGAYRIEAEVEVDGERLTATNAFLAGVPDIQDAEDGVGVSALDEAGQITDTLWDSPDCDIAFQERGALLLTLQQRDTLPGICTLTSTTNPQIRHSISVPLPATRVVTVTGPDRVTSSPEPGGEEQTDGGSEREPEGGVSSDASINPVPAPREPESSGGGCTFGHVSVGGAPWSLAHELGRN